VVVGSATVARGGPPPAAAAPEEAAPEDAEPEPSPADAYANVDFVESERSRDPFRSYLSDFAPTGPRVTERTDVLLPDTPVEAMRVIATITRMASPRAMVLDRAGRGHVIRRGQFVGAPVIVQTGGAGGLAVTLHWRIARIRENGVVLTRDDLSAPNRPPLTQVLPLRPQGEDDGGFVSNVGAVLAADGPETGPVPAVPPMPSPRPAPIPAAPAPQPPATDTAARSL
jgi:type IV pilus assembly protein PilP